MNVQSCQIPMLNSTCVHNNVNVDIYVWWKLTFITRRRVCMYGNMTVEIRRRVYSENNNVANSLHLQIAKLKHSRKFHVVIDRNNFIKDSVNILVVQAMNELCANRCCSISPYWRNMITPTKTRSNYSLQRSQMVSLYKSISLHRVINTSFYEN